MVTYHINPKAVWSDGQPITSTDFKYTWDQIAHGKDIYDTTGYTNIASVDDTDPHTAVVTFKTPYADWKSLFGGIYGDLPEPHPAGQGPRRRDEGRLHLLGRPLEARPLDQGLSRSSWCPTPCTGARSPTSAA